MVMKITPITIEIGDKTLEKEVVIPISERIVVEYLDALFENDIESIMSNYTNRSIVITLKKTYKGLNEIREFMSELIKYFSKKNTVLFLDKMVILNELAYIVWHARSTTTSISMASDTFFIKDEKIRKHTFICQLNKTYRY